MDTTMQRTAASTLTRQKRYGLALLAVIPFFLIGLWNIGDPVPEKQRTLAIALIVLSLTPLVIFFFRPKTSLFPLMPLNCLFYVFAIALAGCFFVGDRYAPMISPGTIQTALEIAILGVAMQMLGYYTTRVILGPGRPVVFVSDLSSRQVRAMAWVMAILRGLSLAVPQIHQLPSIGQFASLSSSVSIAILYSLHLRKQLTTIERVLLFALVMPIEMVSRLNTGSLGNLMLLGLLLVGVCWIVTRKVAWWTILLSVTTLVIFNPVKMQYRAAVWYQQGGAAMSPLDKSQLMVRLASDYWLGTSRGPDVDAVENIRNRVEQLTIFAVVVEATPRDIPYWEGESLHDGFYVFLPRILWPDKPIMKMGNVFGHRYNILHDRDENTSLNLPWLAELYANFGIGGVAGGMLLIGVAFALIEWRFGHPGNAKIDTAVALAITFVLIYPESNLAMLWGGLCLQAAATYATSRVIVALSGPATLTTSAGQPPGLSRPG
jgi:hypothetical protein